jgi:hypothetical protein
MKRKLLISLSLALLILLTITTPVSAAKPVAMGKLIPLDEDTQGSGTYKCYANVEMFRFVIDAVKLIPYTEYHVGYDIYYDGQLYGNCAGIATTDSKGKFSWTSPPDYSWKYYTDYYFIVYVDSDGEFSYVDGK